MASFYVHKKFCLLSFEVKFIVIEAFIFDTEI
jgi:hypothetical protein